MCCRPVVDGTSTAIVRLQRCTSKGKGEDMLLLSVVFFSVMIVFFSAMVVVFSVMVVVFSVMAVLFEQSSCFFRSNWPAESGSCTCYIRRMLCHMVSLMN